MQCFGGRRYSADLALSFLSKWVVLVSPLPSLVSLGCCCIILSSSGWCCLLPPPFRWRSFCSLMSQHKQEPTRIVIPQGESGTAAPPQDGGKEGSNTQKEQPAPPPNRRRGGAALPPLLSFEWWCFLSPLLGDLFCHHFSTVSTHNTVTMRMQVNFAGEEVAPCTNLLALF